MLSGYNHLSFMFVREAARFGFSGFDFGIVLVWEAHHLFCSSCYELLSLAIIINSYVLSLYGGNNEGEMSLEANKASRYILVKNLFSFLSSERFLSAFGSTC